MSYIVISYIVLFLIIVIVLMLGVGYIAENLRSEIPQPSEYDTIGGMMFTPDGIPITPKKYRFRVNGFQYEYWVDDNNHHHFSSFMDNENDVVYNEREAREHNSIFRSLNDQYYKAIGHTPQWLKDERKCEVDNLFVMPPTDNISERVRLREVMNVGRYSYKIDDRGWIYIDDVISGDRININSSRLYMMDNYDPSFKQTHGTALSHVSNVINKNRSNKMRTITSQQAQSIIDIACVTWKETLYQKWGKDIIFKKDINITEEYYEGMRKACTPEQNTLFDTIFGKDVNHLPEGTPCFVRCNLMLSWKLYYADGNGQFYIDGKKSGKTMTWTHVHEYSKGLPPE